MDALTSSNSSRAVFISSCNQSSSLDRLASLPSGEARGCLTYDFSLLLVSWTQLGRMGRARRATGWGCLGRNLWENYCQGKDNGLWSDGSCVLEVMYCEGEPGAAGEACHSCSSAPLTSRPSGSSALVEGGTSGSISLRFTSIMGGSWAGSSVLGAFQSSSALKSNSRASRLLFSHSGQTTWPPHCSSLNTCSWSRQPQAFVQGKPSVRMPMCPLLDKGVWATVLFIRHRHMASYYPHWPTTVAFWPPLPEWVGRLGKDAPTSLLGQKPAHTRWLGLALLNKHHIL